MRKLVLCGIERKLKYFQQHLRCVSSKLHRTALNPSSNENIVCACGRKRWSHFNLPENGKAPSLATGAMILSGTCAVAADSPLLTSECLVSGIVSIQLFGATAWLVIERPDVREIYPYPLTAVLTCRVSTFSLVMSLVYNMILIILCTWYAFKTRKIPENFNEAKYIGFTMYSTCIVWLAFLPIYFGTNNDYKVSSNWYRNFWSVLDFATT